MPAAILDRARTAFRDAQKTLVTHVGIATDSTAFAANQTRLNPTSAGTVLIKPSVETDVDAFTADFTMTINGSTEFTGLVINTVGLLDGPSATDALTRVVRGAGLGIGVQAGDVFTIGGRLSNTDGS